MHGISLGSLTSLRESLSLAIPSEKALTSALNSRYKLSAEQVLHKHSSQRVFKFSEN
jgi:hypothetical protein